MPPARFPIRFTGANRAMAVLGVSRRNSAVTVDETSVEVRMGWFFRSRVLRSSIQAVAEHHGRVWGWGVHGWRGRWLVNGSSSGLVRVAIDPPAGARVLGLPVTLRQLTVAVDDPAGLVATLA